MTTLSRFPGISLELQDRCPAIYRNAFLGTDKVQSFPGIVKITCTYTVHTQKYSMCWGRGVCPISKCNEEIIWTDGSKVTWRRSDKYQLMGDLEHGDVTLTIIGATMDDTGTYCCRVEIPGLFNDLKVQIDVNKEHVELDDVLNVPRVALVYAPTDSTLLDPKVTHKEIEKMFEEVSPIEPDGTRRKMLPITEPSPTVAKITNTPETDVEEVTEINYIPTIIRLTIIFSLTFLPLLIYSCIMKMNNEDKP